MALNSLCMPGLFYHFACLMRSWGLDFFDPPMYGMYPTSFSTSVLSETTPQLLASLSLYLLSYEFIYYWYSLPIDRRATQEKSIPLSPPLAPTAPTAPSAHLMHLLHT